MSREESHINGLLSSWAPFQKPESDKEADTWQYFYSPLFQKFDIQFQDSSEETFLIRPLYCIPKAAESCGPFPSSLFYDECLHKEMCAPSKFDTLTATREDSCLNSSQVIVFV